MVRIEKFIHNRDCFFPDNDFESYNSMLSSEFNVLFHNSVPSCQTWKIPSQTGLFFEVIFLSTNNPMLSSNLNILSHISVISILFALCLHKPYFYFSSAILIALNDNLELYYVDLKIFQRINWYVFLLTIIGQFHFLLWTLCFFLTFLCVCLIYVAEILIIHFFATTTI